MTVRIIQESGVRSILDEVDPEFAQDVVSYIQKESGDHWRYKVVSSQLDADRLDYLLRDGRAAGIQGHTYDLDRLLDMLRHLDRKRIAVHYKGLETVEGYLVALDYMYRAVYFHPTVRAASVLLSSVLRRAVYLARTDLGIFGEDHPIVALVQNGDQCELSPYLRLGEYHLWTLLEAWGSHRDRILADLARRLLARRLFKTMELDPSDLSAIVEASNIAKELTCEHLTHVDKETVELYVILDEPSRTSYKRYDWTATESSDESIWIIGKGKPVAIENYAGSKLISGLKDTRFFPRLVFPAEIRSELLRKLGGSQ